MNLTKAAWELDAIRNDRISTTEQKIARCDAVGFWLGQQKHSKKNAMLCSEAFSLRRKLEGNPSHNGTVLSIG